jgi:integrase/recombinase XerD
MTAIRRSASEYLEVRRSVGFKLQDYERYLFAFVAFLEEQQADYVTTALALQWAQSSTSRRPAEWAKRLGKIRGLARYLVMSDPRTEVPPWRLLPFRSRRARPYLYSDEEIHSLLGAALELGPAGSLRPRTYYTFLGLIAATGIRLGEAIRLQLTDVNFKDGLLTIRDTKFGKSRLVPIHGSTVTALADYAVRRARFLHGRPATHFFLSQRNKPLVKCVIHMTFHELSRRIGLRNPGESHGPRLHDFRHRFAIQTILRWYREGADVEQKLPILSTYLGHVSFEDTYWYVSCCPELMSSALSRLENRWSPAL